MKILCACSVGCRLRELAYCCVQRPPSLWPGFRNNFARCPPIQGPVSFTARLPPKKRMRARCARILRAKRGGNRPSTVASPNRTNTQKELLPSDAHCASVTLMLALFECLFGCGHVDRMIVAGPQGEATHARQGGMVTDH